MFGSLMHDQKLMSFYANDEIPDDRGFVEHCKLSLSDHDLHVHPRIICAHLRLIRFDGLELRFNLHASCK
jgi:hypothetical protein